MWVALCGGTSLIVRYRNEGHNNPYHIFGNPRKMKWKAICRPFLQNKAYHLLRWLLSWRSVMSQAWNWSYSQLLGDTGQLYDYGYVCLYLVSLDPKFRGIPYYTWISGPGLYTSPNLRLYPSPVLAQLQPDFGTEPLTNPPTPTPNSDLNSNITLHDNFPWGFKVTETLKATVYEKIMQTLSPPQYDLNSHTCSV